MIIILDFLVEIYNDYLMIICNYFKLTLIIWLTCSYLIIIWFWLFEGDNYLNYLILRLIIWLLFDLFENNNDCLIIIWNWLFDNYLKIIICIYLILIVLTYLIIILIIWLIWLIWLISLTYLTYLTYFILFILSIHYLTGLASNFLMKNDMETASLEN